MSTGRLVRTGVDRGLRLGRGTADRVIRLAGPRMAGLVGELTSRFRRGPRDHRSPETFTPSRVDGEPSAPTPASVARNIAPRRPTAEPAGPASPARRAAPGASFPPRPRTT